MRPGGAVVHCAYGAYILDAIATAGSDQIPITGCAGQDDQEVGTASSGPGVRNQLLKQLAVAVAQEGHRAAVEKADAGAESKAFPNASVGGTICVPDNLLAQWKNPPPESKMEALQRALKASLRGTPDCSTLTKPNGARAIRAALLPGLRGVRSAISSTRPTAAAALPDSSRTCR
jgi:hypothetical protein